jgi:hypothetical protein
MKNIPPYSPGNPFTLEDPDARSGVNGPVGINDYDWDKTVEDWFFEHPAFERVNYNAQGQPADGDFQRIWNEVKAVQAFLTQPLGPSMSNGDPRRTLRAVVQKSDLIQKAVCLGLGRIKWKSKVDYNKGWVQQCGLFLAVCQLLEERHGMLHGSIVKVFQEPQFDIEDRWILERIGHQTIVKHPAANDEMGRGSFVYAPHFGAHWTFDTFLDPDRWPGLLYTNTMHGSLGTISRPIVDSYFNKVYWSGNPNVNAEANQLFETAEQFLNHHEGVLYWGAYSKDVAVKAASSDSSFYLPKTLGSSIS